MGVEYQVKTVLLSSISVLLKVKAGIKCVDRKKWVERTKLSSHLQL